MADIQITPDQLRRSLEQIEPELMTRVDPAKAEECLAGACGAIGEPSQGRGH